MCRSNHGKMEQYYELMLADEDRWNIRTKTTFDDGTPIDVWAYNRRGETSAIFDAYFGQAG